MKAILHKKVFAEITLMSAETVENSQSIGRMVIHRCLSPSKCINISPSL